MNSTYEFTLNKGPKVKIENFRGTKTKNWYIYRDQKHI